MTALQITGAAMLMFVVFCVFCFFAQKLGPKEAAKAFCFIFGFAGFIGLGACLLTGSIK